MTETAGEEVLAENDRAEPVVPATPAAGSDPTTEVPAAESGSGGWGGSSLTIHREDVLCVAPIMAHNIWLLATIPWGLATFAQHPVLVEWLRGSVGAIIVAGSQVHAGRVAPPLAVVAPLFMLLLPDPFMWWAGRRYGRALIHLIIPAKPSAERRLSRFERLFARWGAWTIAFNYFVPGPTQVLYVLAGESGMSLRRMMVADIVGALMFVGVYLGIGWKAGPSGQGIANSISHYGLIIGLAIMAVVFVVGFRRIWRDPEFQRRFNEE